jgi:gas vesicle protein
MSSIDWENYLSEAIKVFRNGLETVISTAGQKLIKENSFDSLPFSPSQIEVLEFTKKGSTILVLAHDKNLPDMHLNIRKNIDDVNESEFAKKYGYREESLQFAEESILNAKIGNLLGVVSKTRTSIFERPESSRLLGDFFLTEAYETLKEAQVDTIEQTTDGLKKSIAKIPERDIREELLATTNKIDGALQEVKRVDEEISKVRQLVGVSKEFQDWKLLVSDIQQLKGEHVPKEVFDSKVNELNARIDSLSKIREAYDTVLTQQNEFMKQQSEVMKQQSSFVTWIKYATVLVPIAVILVPVIDLLLRHFLNVP